MKANTCLVIDVWEGQLEIDETVLKANGVEGIAIRINDMIGGSHKDEGFDKQWAEAKNFVRFPYFVYNPWVDGAANFAWLSEHMPVGASSVAIDVEVSKSGYSAATYAGEVVKFLNLCKLKGWRTIIYTAQWFLTKLTTWPKVDYWWAQYPFHETYFPTATSWDGVKRGLDRLTTPFNSSSIPGTLKMWQFSGDYFVLPGTLRKMDLNIFYGDKVDLATYFRSTPDSITLPDPTPETIPDPIVICPSVTDPIVIPEPKPISKSGLYIFTKDAYWHRPSAGPLVTPTYNITKTSGAKDTLLSQNWINKLREWNTNGKSMGKILAPDWGPSKGLNKNGKLIFINLIYPGRNLVSIKNVVVGTDGGQWGELEYIDADTMPGPEVNPIDRPDLIHRVYGSNPSWGWYPLSSSPAVPLLSFDNRFVEMKWLTPLDAFLPKTVKLNRGLGLNVRGYASITAPIINSVKALQVVTIHEVKIGKGGIWGRCDLGWIALRNNDLNLTDWQI